MAHNTKPLNTFHLFSGAGGGILADVLLGHNPIGACEIEKYPRDVLLARQADGHLPAFPIWDDVATLDGNPWRGSVDILCGGFPCQDISAAGKGAGITGERSGLWKEYARLIEEIQPRFVFAENSPLLRTRGLGVVLEDLASLGYNARWGIIGAGDVGAPHKRDRMWVLAYSKREQDNGERRLGELGRDSLGWQEKATFREDGEASSDCIDGQGETPSMAYSNVPRDGASRRRSDIDGSEIIEGRQIESQPKPRGQGDAMADSDSTQRQGARFSCGSYKEDAHLMPSGAWWGQDPAEVSEPIVGRMADGVANRVHRLKAIGNGQVPQCAAVAFNVLSRGLI